MGARIWNFVHIENSVVQILGIFLMDKNPRAIDSNLPIFSHLLNPISLFLPLHVIYSSIVDRLLTLTMAIVELEDNHWPLQHAWRDKKKQQI